MKKIPDGALLQKSKNNVSYVYFPSYYYDKNAKTHNKEKQKRLYIGKVVNGEFIPNKKYLANPELSRKDVGSLITESQDLSKIRSRSFGATFLLQTLAEKYGLTEDLTSVYGEELANQLLSLAMFMTLESQFCIRSGRDGFGCLQTEICRPNIPVGYFANSEKMKRRSTNFSEREPNMCVHQNISHTTARKLHRPLKTSTMFAGLRVKRAIINKKFAWQFSVAKKAESPSCSGYSREMYLM